MTVLEDLVSALSADSAERAKIADALAYLVQRQDLSGIRGHQLTLEIDSAVAGILETLGVQLDAILHHPEILALEAAWLELSFVVARIDYDSNTTTEILSCTREEFDEDLNQSPEVTSSGLYSTIYRNAIGMYGGSPYGILTTYFRFGPHIEDLTTLKLIASIAAMAHAPLLADADPAFFDLVSYSHLPQMTDLSNSFLGERFAAWRAFRESEDARYVGLCLPRFVLRQPHDVHNDTTTPIRYRENLPRGSRDLLWGHAASLVTVIAAGSFARYRWCVFLTGSNAGAVTRLHRWEYASLVGIWSRCSLECVVTNRAERALAEQGFISLVFERSRGQATMLSSPSLRSTTRPSQSRAPTEDDIGQHLGSQLTYVFLVCRLAHYIKLIQQEQIGAELDRGALESVLTKWISRYISDMDNPAPDVLAARPLRSASVEVQLVEGQTGWYRCSLRIRPHLTHNNATFTLALVGKLDHRQGGHA